MSCWSTHGYITSWTYVWFRNNSDVKLQHEAVTMQKWPLFRQQNVNYQEWWLETCHFILTVRNVQRVEKYQKKIVSIIHFSMEFSDFSSKKRMFLQFLLNNIKDEKLSKWSQPHWDLRLNNFQSWYASYLLFLQFLLKKA